MQGGFAGSRSASRSAKDGASSKKLLIGYKKVKSCSVVAGYP
jgi:hypothetical protein